MNAYVKSGFGHRTTLTKWKLGLQSESFINKGSLDSLMHSIVSRLRERHSQRSSLPEASALFPLDRTVAHTLRSFTRRVFEGVHWCLSVLVPSSQSCCLASGSSMLLQDGIYVFAIHHVDTHADVLALRPRYHELMRKCLHCW